MSFKTWSAAQGTPGTTQPADKAKASPDAAEPAAQPDKAPDTGPEKSPVQEPPLRKS